MDWELLYRCFLLSAAMNLFFVAWTIFVAVFAHERLRLFIAATNKDAGGRE